MELSGNATVAVATSEGGEEQGGESGGVTEDVVQKVRGLMRRIMVTRQSPDACLLHLLASVLEQEECRYEEQVGYSCTNNLRSTHTIGLLVTSIQEDDDFFELLSSKLLVDSGHTFKLRAAAARLLLACISFSMYPHVLEEQVLLKIKQWVMEDAAMVSNGGALGRRCAMDIRPVDSNDRETLRTYATGLLAIALQGGDVVEDVLATGMVAGLMHYLRTRCLRDDGDTDDVEDVAERSTTGFRSNRARDESRGRIKLSVDSSLMRKVSAGDRELIDMDPQGIGKLEQGAEMVEKTTVEGVNCSKLAHVGDLEVASAIDIKEDAATSCVMVGNVNIGVVIQKAVRAAKAEARAANAPFDAVKAAGDAAADLVRVAAIEELVLKGADDDAVLAAASVAASTVVDAAQAVHVKETRYELSPRPMSNFRRLKDGRSPMPKCNRCRVVIQIVLHRDESSKTNKQEAEELPETKDHYCELGVQGVCAVDMEALARLREHYCVQCLEKMGEYLEVLGPVLHEKGVDVCIGLLQRQCKLGSSQKDMNFLSDILKLVCSLAAHRKFASLLVDRGGVQQLLATPRVPQTLTGISLCLCALASPQGIMERVCALPAAVVKEIVSLGLQLLECSQDPARRNAAIFFGSSFVFGAVLGAFDTEGGLQKVLNLLDSAAYLRSGGVSAASSSEPVLSRIDRGMAAEVFTSSGKQVAYHACVALRQYLRAHLLVLVDSLRTSKGHRGGPRNSDSRRFANKPADISNEAIDTIILQLQEDRKLGPAFVRSRWNELEKLMIYGGHKILLELTQAGPNERYQHEISQHALGVLQIVTLMPFTRKPVAGSVLSNDRSGMAVILDAAGGTGLGHDREVTHAALLVLVNLVCPPPSMCSRSILTSSMPAVTSHFLQGSHTVLENPDGGINGWSGNGILVPNVEGKDNAGNEDVTVESNGIWPICTFGSISVSRHMVPVCPATPVLNLVGDRRILFGPGAGSSGLAAYMEQGYHYARESIRANNGIKVLLHLLYATQLFPPGSMDCIRALACRALLGLTRDIAIAHILTKLQVGKLLSELLRDDMQTGYRAGANGVGGEQGRWQDELRQVALELMAVVTNTGRASAVAASEAAAPTLRRIERAAVAAATPISYHSRELLQLIHQHLVTSGLQVAATALLNEAQVEPLPSTLPIANAYASAPTVRPSRDHQWPMGVVPGGCFTMCAKINRGDDGLNKWQHVKNPLWKIAYGASSALAGVKASVTTSGPLKNSQQSTSDIVEPQNSFSSESSTGTNLSSGPAQTSVQTFSTVRPLLPMKRKAMDKEWLPFSPSKGGTQGESKLPATMVTPRNPSSPKSSVKVDPDLCLNPVSSCFNQHDNPVKNILGPKVCLPPHEKSEIANPFHVEYPSTNQDQLFPFASHHACHHGLNPFHVAGLPPESFVGQIEHTTLDSLVLQYLKHQHRQCPTPIATLPPLSLLHPHVCPVPSRTSDAPLNTTLRLACRERRAPFGGLHGRRHERHFVYSRFRPWRTCRDEAIILTATTFLGAASCLAAGSLAGDIRFFNSKFGGILETHACHTSPITLLQSAPKQRGLHGHELPSRTGQLLLSSSMYDARLWDSSVMGNGPLHVFEGCRAAWFSHSGGKVGALGSDSPQKEVLLYNVTSCKLEQTLSDKFSLPSGQSRGHAQATVHFSPSDVLVLWSGVLWDHRIPRAIHHFDQFSDYGGGGFHPAGNEIIINSEVWDMRSFKLLRSVPALDQTSISFNTTGDVIYATLRRNSDDIRAALNSRRARHPLYAAFKTVDAVDYSDITTIAVDRCVLDLATEHTDSFLALVVMDSNEEMDSFARIYEVGRRRPTDDDSDPDDGGETDEDSEADEDVDGLQDAGDSELDVVSDDDDHSGGEEEVGEDYFGDMSDENGGRIESVRADDSPTRSEDSSGEYHEDDDFNWTRPNIW